MVSSRRSNLCICSHCNSSLKCPVVAHWKCLSYSQRDEILNAMREKDKTEQAENPDTLDIKPKKRSGLATRESTDFICGSCIYHVDLLSMSNG